MERERKCKYCGAEIIIDSDKRVVKIKTKQWFICSECNKFIQVVLKNE